MTKADIFASEFRAEHRVVRDLFLDMINALKRKDVDQAKSMLLEVSRAAGPHFRYEEEMLYPSLASIYGNEYINKLLTDHDYIIAKAKWLVDFVDDPARFDHDYDKAILFVQSLLPHVSDCEGLSIMVERVDEELVDKIMQTREKANNEGKDLINWAETVRERPVAELS